MTIAYFSPFPYVILLVVLLVTIVACFGKFPSLRSIRKPKNLLIYLIMLLLLGVVAYQAYDASLGISIVTYNVNFADNEIVADQTFKLDIVCENLGIRETSFYLILTSTNASLTVGNQQDYIQINDTALKIPFNFVAASIHTKETKSVLVNIDETASNFRLDFKSPVIATGGVIGVEGQWNEITSGYKAWTRPGPCV